MSTVNVTIDLNVEDLVYSLTVDELWDLIEEIDLRVGDWEFTEKFWEYGDRMRKAFEREQENEKAWLAGEQPLW